jgi:hypothetical protein
MKSLVTAAFLNILTFACYGQAYNNIQNYSLINGLIGGSRQTISARLAKAGYRLMTRQEVNQKEGEVLPQNYFNVRMMYRYTGTKNQRTGPWFVSVAFDYGNSDKAAAIYWNEFLAAGRGAVLDNALLLHNLRQYDTIEGGVGPTYFYKNDLRNLICQTHENSRLLKFTLAVNRGN